MLKVRLVADETDMETCREIRHKVFIEEQGVDPKEEYDDLDPVCAHFLASVDGVPAGTARLFFPPDILYAKAQRVATLYSFRGHGVGRALMFALEDHAHASGVCEVRLAAQVSALAFYERLGYNAFGDVFMDANIEHRNMTKYIRKA